MYITNLSIWDELYVTMIKTTTLTVEGWGGGEREKALNQFNVKFNVNWSYITAVDN